MLQKYFETKTLKKPKRKAFWIIFCFVLIFFLVLIFSIIFSPMLKIVNLSSKNVYALEANYYFVCLNTGILSREDAQKEAQNIKSRGGAGIVFFDEVYFVFVSCYENEDEAKKIKESLENEEQKFEVKKKSFSFNIKNIEKTEREEFCDYYNFLVDVLKSLYNLSNSLDKNETTKIGVNLKIKSLKTQTNLKLQHINSSLSLEHSKMQKAFITLLSCLEYCGNEDLLESAVLPYSSVLREMRASMILSLSNLWYCWL